MSDYNILNLLRNLNLKYRIDIISECKIEDVIPPLDLSGKCTCIKSGDKTGIKFLAMIEMIDNQAYVRFNPNCNPSTIYIYLRGTDNIRLIDTPKTITSGNVELKVTIENESRFEAVLYCFFNVR